MARKRKKRPEDLEITVLPAPVNEVKTDQYTFVEIRCIWDSRLIIGGHMTKTGRRYEFEQGQTGLVDIEDYQLLLALEARPYGCCGGTVKPQKYFDEV